MNQHVIFNGSNNYNQGKQRLTARTSTAHRSGDAVRHPRTQARRGRKWGTIAAWATLGVGDETNVINTGISPTRVDKPHSPELNSYLVIGYSPFVSTPYNNMGRRGQSWWDGLPATSANMAGIPRMQRRTFGTARLKSFVSQLMVSIGTR